MGEALCFHAFLFCNCVRIPPRLPRNWPGPLGHPSLRNDSSRALARLVGMPPHRRSAAQCWRLMPVVADNP